MLLAEKTNDTEEGAEMLRTVMQVMKRPHVQLFSAACWQYMLAPQLLTQIEQGCSLEGSIANAHGTNKIFVDFEA